MREKLNGLERKSSFTLPVNRGNFKCSHKSWIQTLIFYATLNLKIPYPEKKKRPSGITVEIAIL